MKARAGALVAASFLSLAAARFGGDSPVKPPTEADRIKALPDEERQWLTEFVAAILLPEEKTVFLELTEPYQREAFKLDFWSRREKPGLPQPLGPGYRERYEQLWRLAEEKYDGWRKDAGRMLLRWGEPAEILQPKCGGEDVFRDLEVWTYNNLGWSGRQTAKYIFYRPFIFSSPRRLWTLNDRETDVFTQNACRRSFADLRPDCGSGTPRCPPCEDRCQVYKAYLEILARQGSPLGAAMEYAHVFEPFKVSTEGLDRQKDRWATTSNPKAKTIHVEGPSSSGWIETPSPTPVAATTPEPPHSLSPDEIRDRIRQLEPKYREWLDLARPLLTDEELSLFLQLPTKEKDGFIQKFWKSRS
jgi:GWxTD domain-containing protein